MRVPKLCRQREKLIPDRAYVELNGKRIQCGDWGSVEAKQKYDRLIAEWLANHRQLPAEPTRITGNGISIAEMLQRFFTYAETYYADCVVGEDKATGELKLVGELRNYTDALRPLSRQYAELPAAEFGPTKLKALRQWMIQAKWCRNYINRQIKRVVRVFKWAAENELIEPAVYQRLALFESLRKDRSGAEESEPVVPVTQEQVDAVRPFLLRTVEALMDLHWLTGARSGELLKLRPIDIKTGATDEDNWTYSPAKHKTAHHKHKRTIVFGPKAKSILRELMAGQAMDARLFEPYDRNSYRIAIARACDKAFLPPERLARLRVPAGGRKKLRMETRAEWRKRLGEAAWTELQEWKGRHRWHPHQLRHGRLTLVRSVGGLEAAQLVGGHKKQQMTEHYAEPDLTVVHDLMKKLG